MTFLDYIKKFNSNFESNQYYKILANALQNLENGELKFITLDMPFATQEKQEILKHFLIWYNKRNEEKEILYIGANFHKAILFCQSPIKGLFIENIQPTIPIMRIRCLKLGIVIIDNCNKIANQQNLQWFYDRIYVYLLPDTKIIFLDIETPENLFISHISKEHKNDNWIHINIPSGDVCH